MIIGTSKNAPPVVATRMCAKPSTTGESCLGLGLGSSEGCWLVYLISNEKMSDERAVPSALRL